MNQSADNHISGIFWMLATMFWFIALDTTAKYLLQEYSVVQVVWGRFFFHFVFVVAFMGRNLPTQMRSHAPWYQLARSFFMFITTFLFFVGINYLSLATASTIMFMSPVIITVLSIPLLGERVGIRRWIGVAIGFAGALVVIQPGGELQEDGLQVSMLIVLFAALTNALYQIFTRKLGKHDGPMTALFYTGLVGAVVTSIAVPFFWRPVPSVDWLLFILLGIIGGVGHLCLIRAFQRAPASVVAPFSYSSLLWATIFGFVLFGELPGLWTWVGAALIMSSGLYIFHREQKAKSHGT